MKSLVIALFSIFSLTSFSQKKMTLYFDTNSSELSQKEMNKFNEFMKEKRELYHSLFLTNYRESNSIARKRISFNLVYEIVNYLI